MNEHIKSFPTAYLLLSIAKEEELLKKEQNFQLFSEKLSELFVEKKHDYSLTFYLIKNNDVDATVYLLPKDTLISKIILSSDTPILFENVNYLDFKSFMDTLEDIGYVVDFFNSRRFHLSPGVISQDENTNYDDLVIVSWNLS